MLLPSCTPTRPRARHSARRTLRWPASRCTLIADPQTRRRHSVMSDSVTMPALGESVTEGTVTRWLKQVGDTVAVDEPLVEVSTDKVDTEIPSPFGGVLEQILVAEDETVAVGAPLAIIGTGASAEAAPTTPEPAAEPAAPAEEAPAPVLEPEIDVPRLEEPAVDVPTSVAAHAYATPASAEPAAAVEAPAVESPAVETDAVGPS